MKILIAEDDNLVRKTIEIKLSKDGHEIISLAEGKAAIENINTMLPDMVITDIMLPGASGLEIVSTVKNITSKDIKVIVLSTMGQENIVEEAFKLGADEYITKPFSLTELSIRVKKLMSRV
ncbi:response regulator receiver domain-containing protein [Chitinophaga skermanii]|uniref:Response regulator receiver domain-containing protein n=1 Tax=Chitinophaga skermanii TaxID=331697 RepID=A0A327PZT1_9BACT|nr:response regulator transcription factor [Chitinophaga skermanii]RAI97569.1 response regulator receiver domain-containing protein [Chitinophaga skermanii]